jgi:peroxiredoxin
MLQNRLFQYALQACLFALAFGVIFLTVQWARTPAPAASALDDDSGMAGIARGAVVALPQLPRLDGGGDVALGDTKEKYLLIGLISTSCPGCSKDADFWQGLQAEAARRGVAFYIVAVDKEPASVERFARAYGFDQLPVLVDTTGAAARGFKVSVVPQYILLTSEGEVRNRWNGLSHTDLDNRRAAEPAQFFSQL